MKKVEYKITDELGIHARPAADFIKLNNEFKSEIKIFSNGNEANGKSILSVMKLAVKQGDTIIVNIDGTDEQSAENKISEFLKNNL